MKKILLTALFLSLCVPASMLYAAKSNVDLKLVGISYPSHPEKISYDGGLSFNIGLDKFFAIGLESGIGWISWEESTGLFKESLVGTTEQKIKTNAFSFPALLCPQLRVPLGYGEQVTIFIAPGAGWSWTLLSQGDEGTTYNGFTWQAMAGVAFKLGYGSNMQVMIEGGYRRAALSDKDDYELNMSGPIVHAGVRFDLGGGGF